MNNHIIRLENVQKVFNGTPVLKGVDLDVVRGETLVVIGRSGCGKSVMLKHLVGLLKPDAGDIIVDGHSIANATEDEMRAIRKEVGFLFQLY